MHGPISTGGRVLLLVDGHRLNDSIYDTAANVADFILDVDLIDRIEIIRGPGSSLYGNNAFFAVINVITRKGQDMQGVELAGKAGSFDSYDGRVSYGRDFDNGLELRLSGSYYESDGQDRLYYEEFDQPENNHGIAKGVDGDISYRLFGSLAYGDLTLRGAFVSRDKTVPTGSYGTVFNSPDATTLDERYFVEVGYAHRFADDLDVKARLYYDWYGYVGGYPYNYSEQPGDTITLNQDLDDIYWWGGEAQVSKRLFSKHRLTAGVEYRDEYQITHRNFDRSPFVEYANLDTSSQVYSFYIQDEYTPWPTLTLNGGIRYDYFSIVGETINPRVAAIYNPWEKTTFKLLYGEAFRAPNVYEYAYSSVSNRPNPNLQPETIKTYEAI
jgi:iron complex outermembrane receptor protein